MNPLNSIHDLQSYCNDIKTQQNALQQSTVFSPMEKIELQQIYTQQLQIAQKRLADLQNLIDTAQ